MSPSGIPFWIHNVQCVPDATTNLLSVSAAIADGLRMVSSDTGAFQQLVGSDSWDCPVREADGLYLLSGVVPIPAMPSLNVARAFKVSCSDQLPHNCT
jgi:hypothetical protein